MTATTLTRKQLDQLAPGDTITAIDGRPLRRPVTVAGRLARIDDGHGPLAVRLVNPRGTATVDNLYPDTHVHQNVTVEHPTPQTPSTPRAPRAPRPAVRIIDGLRLISDGKGEWLTEDGQYGIGEGFAVSQCTARHPVKLTAHAVEQARVQDPDYWEIATAHSAQRRYYQCPGWIEHATRIGWQPFSTRGDLGLDVSHTFEDAARALAKALQQPAGR